MSHFACKVACLVAALALAPLGRSTEPRSLTIIMQFEHRYSAASVEEMKVEFERIVLPAKLRLEWLMVDGLTGRETFQQIVIVHFKGDCEADHTAAATRSSQRLGLTHIVGDALSPFTELDCGQIRSLMAQNQAAETTIQFARLLGRAMARVLAHEVYHAVLKTTQHGPRGITKASLTRADLFSGTLRFEPDQIARLGDALTSFAAVHDRSAVTSVVLPVNAKAALIPVASRLASTN